MEERRPHGNPLGVLCSLARTVAETRDRGARHPREVEVTGSLVYTGVLRRLC